MRSLSLVIFADFSTSVGDENDMVVYTGKLDCILLVDITVYI